MGLFIYAAFCYTCVGLLALSGLVVVIYDAIHGDVGRSQAIAGWVQAVGSILAIVASVAVVYWQLDRQRREREDKEDADRLRHALDAKSIAMRLWTAIAVVIFASEAKNRPPKKVTVGNRQVVIAATASTNMGDFQALEADIQRILNSSLPHPILHIVLSLQATVRGMSILLSDSEDSMVQGARVRLLTSRLDETRDLQNQLDAIAKSASENIEARKRPWFGTTRR